MKFLRKILPDFLQQIDHQLLINRPWLWTVKFPYHLWVLLLINIVLAIAAWLAPLSIEDIPDLEFLFGLTFILQVTYFCFWVYAMVRFNRDKAFGKWKFYQSQVQFFLWWVSILLILSMAYTPTAIMAYRIDHSVSDEQFQADLNTLLLGRPYFYGERGDYEYFFSKEDFEKRIQRQIDVNNDTNYWAGKYPKLPESMESIIGDALNKEGEFGIYDEGYLDTLTFRDSIIHYREIRRELQRSHPRYYTDFKSTRNSHKSFTDVLTQQEFFDHYVYALDQPISYAQGKLLARLEVAMKYGKRYKYEPQVYADFYAYFHRKHIDKSDLTATWKFPMKIFAVPDGGNSYTTNLSRIRDAKINDYFFFEFEFLMVAGIVAFFLTLLLFLFTSFRWQNFLASIATGIVVSILIGVSIAFIHQYNEENVVFMEIYGLFWVFLGLALILGISRVHSHIASTCWILIIAAMPLIPVQTIYLLNRQFDVFNRNQYDDQLEELRVRYQADEITYEQYEPERERLDRLDTELRERIRFYTWISFIGGMVVFFFFFVPLVKWRANRMLAFPKRK